MKREFALSAVAIVISVLLSSPSVAQTAPKPMNAVPAPAPVEATAPVQAAEELSLDEAILMASTPQERAAVIRRCSGPPPRLQQTAQAELPAPASEPAAFQ